MKILHGRPRQAPAQAGHPGTGDPAVGSDADRAKSLDLARHQEINDGRTSAPVKQIKNKSKAVTEALAALSKLMMQKGKQKR